MPRSVEFAFGYLLVLRVLRNPKFGPGKLSPGRLIVGPGRYRYLFSASPLFFSSGMFFEDHKIKYYSFLATLPTWGNAFSAAEDCEGLRGVAEGCGGLRKSNFRRRGITSQPLVGSHSEESVWFRGVARGRGDLIWGWVI